MDLFGEEEVLESDDEDIIDHNADLDIEVFSHPRSMTHLAGHEDIESELLSLFNSGRMPHGIILSGIKGIGKATLAYKLTRFLLKHGADDPNQDGLFGEADDKPTSLEISKDDPVFFKVASGGHPDLLTLERQYDATKNKTAESLAVSELRKVEPFLRMTSSNGGWRVVIIDDADTMNRNAQNALLKILEEPPKNTLLILVAHRLGALIPTIRSRTRLISIKPLEGETINELLKRKGYELDSNQTEIISSLSDGSFGKTCKIVEEGGLENLMTIVSLIGNSDGTAIHALSEQLSRAGQEQAYKAFTENFLWIYKTLCFAKARGQSLSPASLNEEPLSTILKKSSLQQLLSFCENLSNHFEMTQRNNLDKRQAVLGAFHIVAA